LRYRSALALESAHRRVDLVNNQLKDIFLASGMGVAVGTVGTVLASAWYRITQKDPLTWDSVAVFAKIFYGIGSLAIISYLLFRYM
jgi:hypothetical protein